MNTGSSGLVSAHVMTVEIRIKYLFLDSPAPPSSASDVAEVATCCFSSKSFKTVRIIKYIKLFIRGELSTYLSSQNRVCKDFMTVGT